MAQQPLFPPPSGGPPNFLDARRAQPSFGKGSGGGGDGGIKAVAILLGVVLLLSLAVAAVGLAVIEDDDRAAKAKPVVEQTTRDNGNGWVTVVGRLAGVGSLELTYREAPSVAKTLQMRVEGSYDPGRSEEGGAIVVTRVAAARCPVDGYRTGTVSEELRLNEISAFDVFADGPFQGGGHRDLGEYDVGKHRICGYLSTAPAGRGGKLIVDAPIELTSGEVPDRPRDSDLITPGTYVGTGRDLLPGTVDSRIEITIKRSGKGRGGHLFGLRASGLLTEQCEDDLQSPSTAKISKPDTDAYRDFTVFAFDDDLMVTGGAWSEDEIRGQLYLEDPSGFCKQTILFSARRR